ncbi:hypothetical protein KCP78_23155 [Salmonella enterica subsp. enterica]|nr:hypothetical protein KCP78_23155 [Salmonella enterica subsp. enterica]
MRDWVSQRSAALPLRSQNPLDGHNDRVVEGDFTISNAEHSAQQSSERLQRYERMFGKRQLNVLTAQPMMEMGCDIGGLRW